MSPLEENWLALTLVERIGTATLRGLIGHFGSVEALLSAAPEEIGRAGGIHPELAQRLSRAREVSAFRVEKGLVERHGVRLLPLEDPAYPALLREVNVPPPLLYCRGEFPLPQGTALAVVGTRAHTRYGEKATRRLIGELARLDPQAVIVSGLARGIDTVAHEEALACGLKTVAVMAGGLTRVYPPENAALAERIVAQGAMITEFHMTRSPRANNFPIRNRVISGLSAGVLVCEAGEKSGALITAGFALNYGRPVFAVPGNIDEPSAEGTNRLIRSGQARLVRSGRDVLEGLAAGRQPSPTQLDWLAPEPAAPKAPRALLEGEKGRIVACLGKGPLHPDDLVEELLIPIERLVGLLLELELSGEIYQTADNLYGLA